MKTSSLAVLALVGMMVLAASATYHQGTNLIVNGDFSQNSCASSFCIYNQGNFQQSYVPGWQPLPEIEVGKGSVYSAHFAPEEYVAELDANANTCIVQNLGHVESGRYAFSFEYAARWDRSLGDTTFGVWAGDFDIGSITPINYERTIQEAIIDIPYSCEDIKIKFCGKGDSTSYGVVITNVKLVAAGKCQHAPKYPPRPSKPEIYCILIRPEFPSPPKPELPHYEKPQKPDYQFPTHPKPETPEFEYPDKPNTPTIPNPEIPDIDIPDRPTRPDLPVNCCNGDLIVNGGFESNTCGGSFCIFGAGTFQPSFVPGWTPNPEIEVGHSSNYNANIPSTTVAELDANANTCIEQTVKSCGAGSYILSFNYAARQHHPLATSIFQVKINGQVIESIIPSDYSLATEQRVVQLAAGASTVSFCAYSGSDSFGAVIDNVSLKCANKCQVCKFTGGKY